MIVCWGLFPSQTAKTNPIRTTAVAVIFKRQSDSNPLHPKQPETANAAATGAVMALVSPAANNPIEKINFEFGPSAGSSCFAISSPPLPAGVPF